MSLQFFLLYMQSLEMLRLCLILNLATTIQASFEGFIVGGSLGDILNFPHSAWLRINCINGEGNSEGKFVCGASILNQNVLLTAAHCVYLCGNGTHIAVNMGHNTKEKGVMRSGSSFLFHERFNTWSMSFDIALVKMSKAVTFNSKVSRVAILKYPPYHEAARLAGWGMMDEYEQIYPKDLKQVDQRVWKREACTQIFNMMPKGTICASAKKETDFPAHGDSGSGLVVRGYILIGLVSHKIPETANNVIIYTDIGFHYDWIQNNANRIYCHNA